jgi:hypothetical protein
MAFISLLYLVVNDLPVSPIRIIAITALKFIYSGSVVIIVLFVCIIVLVEVFSNCIVCFVVGFLKAYYICFIISVINLKTNIIPVSP